MSGRFWASLLVFGTAVLVAAAAGGHWTARGVDSGWYDGLTRPSWTPAGSTIGIVWTVLYVLIAVASALVGAKGPAKAYGALLSVNLVLNALWCYLFFAAQRPSAALAELALLELTCIFLIVLAARVSPPAAWLLVPYAVWVAFAGVLNEAIARRN